MDSSNRELLKQKIKLGFELDYRNFLFLMSGHVRCAYLESGTSRPRLWVLLRLADSELSSLSSFTAFSSGLYRYRVVIKLLVWFVC